MAINSIYKYLKEGKLKLKEELHVEGLQFLGNAYGFDVYRATTYDGAQALVVGNTNQLAGEGFVNSQDTFNAHINEEVRLYFFVRENTNHVFMGCISGQGRHNLVIQETNLNISTNYLFQNITGDHVVLENAIIPLFLIPEFEYNGHDGIIIQDNDILGTYAGLIDPQNIPEQVELSNINDIKTNAFKHYPVPVVTLGENISHIKSNAFFDYRGTIRCAAESPSDGATEGWQDNWNGNCESIVWGINLSPEEIARRLQAAKDSAKSTLNDYAKPENYREAEQQRLAEIMRDAIIAIDACEIPADTSIEVEKTKELINDLKTKEQYEAEEAERRRIELQAAETLNVLRYKQNGNEITILGCKPGREKLDIPSEINGKPVTTIGPFAFYENTTVTEINLPQTIKLIAKAAFYGCSNLVLKYPKSATLYTDAIKGVRRAYPF